MESLNLINTMSVNQKDSSLAKSSQVKTNTDSLGETGSLAPPSNFIQPNLRSSQKDEEAENEGHNVLLDLKSGVINEKTQRCKEFADGKQGTISLVYRENTPKEELVLEHVKQYKRQFKLLYPQFENRELFLYPKNECELYKFICTTIRPTKLGFLELYNYEQCAKCISKYIQYEELDKPNEFPEIIPSPTNVLMWQKGDCFDISIVLCSLLVGAGYDAYCVYGIAPYEITSKNEALMPCPDLATGELVEEEEEKEEDLPKENEFKIHKKKEIESKFDREKEEAEKNREDERKRVAMTINDDEPEDLPEDQYFGERIHCWVLLKKGKRDIAKNIFIEPSTGRIYPLDDSPYQSVEGVFSHQNFWINMVPDMPVKDLIFDDMEETANWEYVMLDTVKIPGSENHDEDAEKDYDDPAFAKEHEKMKEEERKKLGELDMPKPWPPKLYIDKELFFKLSPMGEHTAFYLKSRVDTYAPYTQEDGLVKKIMLYEDFKRMKIKEIRQLYEYRSDKLRIRRRYPFDFKVIEEYDPGKPPHWKQVIEIDRRLRIIKFYPNRNVDGLIMREERIGEKTIEYYENRDDRVIYRSVRFDNKREGSHKDYFYPDNHIGQVVVTKMTQKFEKNPNLPANEQIAKMIMDLVKQKVQVYFHMNEGEINPMYKEYMRESMLGFAKLNEGTGDKKDDPLIQQENQKMLSMEKDCYQQIKQQELSAGEEEKQMREEKVSWEMTLHDKAREKNKDAHNKKDDDGDKESSADDYLAPFLEKRMNSNNKVLTKSDALEIKNEVMLKLKKRLLSRAEIIQNRLEEEKLNLEKKEQSMQKKGEHISKEDEKKYQEALAELNFKIDILNHRASRFEIMALKKYEEMDKKLQEDKRLAILHQK